MPRLDVGDIQLYYEIAGQGQPIVFIHGLGSSTRDWAAQVDFFSKMYRTVTFDLRGHGRSAKPKGRYSIPLFAADTAGLIETLELAPAHVVGISLGGMVALQLAVDAPPLVKSLVVANSVAEYRLRSLKDWLLALRRLFIVHGLGMRRMGQFLSKQLFIKPDQVALSRSFIERWAENDRWTYSAAMRAIAGWSVLDRLGEIRCPTLIVSADEDVFPLAVKQAYAAKIPQAKVVIIPDSRHFTTLERPEAFNKSLLAFLTEGVVVWPSRTTG